MTNERVQLSDSTTENIVGGKFRYISNPFAGQYCWGESNPDVKYGFKETTKVISYVQSYGNLDDEDGIIQGLLAQGLIWPL